MTIEPLRLDQAAFVGSLRNYPKKALRQAQHERDYYKSVRQLKNVRPELVEG